MGTAAGAGRLVGVWGRVRLGMEVDGMSRVC